MRGVSKKAGLVAGLAVFGLVFAGVASAVHLDPRGFGQVLLYPYYTVNAHQQTYLTVVNTADRAKAVQVSVREGYNGRPVLTFALFLSQYDVWTGTIFALEDIGDEGGAGAALLTTDASCTVPDLRDVADGTLNGHPYVRFALGPAPDGGPQGDARTREGHVELVALADLTGALRAAVSQDESGRPRGCHMVAGDLSNGVDDMHTPSGSLFGSAAVINVAEGTYYPFRADALRDFTRHELLSRSGEIADALGEVNDGAQATRVTAHVHAGDRSISASYDASAPQYRIDAVSAALMADAIHNEYVVDPALGAHSDWVVTFPTKRFYTDPALLPAGSAAVQPFVALFEAPGRSCVQAPIRYFNREQLTTPGDGSGFPGMPPPRYPKLCYGTNVASFLIGERPEASFVLGSRLLVEDFSLRDRFENGWAVMDLDPYVEPHRLRTSLNVGGAGDGGKTFLGLPAIGFWASNLVNGQVAEGVLSNYSGVSAHAMQATCVTEDETVFCE